MRYHVFKDSKGREFESNVAREGRPHGVDTIFILEDAYYLDGQKESVPEDELDWVYNSNDADRINTIGHEEAMGYYYE